ncbi:hypothetical protein C8R44DRAFT_730288 [Mycena epipterygia]|nr:hypothetical protein C8R44DRAFT_730288 [Mycena epipterygia]
MSNRNSVTSTKGFGAIFIAQLKQRHAHGGVGGAGLQGAAQAERVVVRVVVVDVAVNRASEHLWKVVETRWQIWYMIVGADKPTDRVLCLQRNPDNNGASQQKGQQGGRGKYMKAGGGNPQTGYYAHNATRTMGLPKHTGQHKMGGKDQRSPTTGSEQTSRRTRYRYCGRPGSMAEQELLASEGGKTNHQKLYM